MKADKETEVRLVMLRFLANPQKRKQSNLGPAQPYLLIF